VFTHLLWVQGESDAALGTTQNDYYRRFNAMLAAIRGLGVNAPAFVAVATRCGQFPPNAAIRQAQIDLRDVSRGVFAGPDLDALDERWRIAGCHFSNAGLDQHARLWLDVIKQHATQTPASAGAIAKQ
jgi:hypothetical protein